MNLILMACVECAKSKISSYKQVRWQHMRICDNSKKLILQKIREKLGINIRLCFSNAKFKIQIYCISYCFCKKILEITRLLVITPVVFGKFGRLTKTGLLQGWGCLLCSCLLYSLSLHALQSIKLLL